MQYKNDLSMHRLEKAKECLVGAKMLFENNQYFGAANRSYYSVFHSMRSVLALNGVDFKKHSAVIAYFRSNYIKAQKIETRLSDIIEDVFELRTQSDYNDFFIVSKEEVKKQIENAEYFVTQVEAFLEKQ